MSEEKLKEIIKVALRKGKPLSWDELTEAARSLGYEGDVVALSWACGDEVLDEREGEE